jgi:hypothetical protein
MSSKEDAKKAVGVIGNFLKEVAIETIDSAKKQTVNEVSALKAGWKAFVAATKEK